MAASLESLLLALDSRSESPRQPPTGHLVRAMELQTSRRRRRAAARSRRVISKKRRRPLQGPRKHMSRIESRLRALWRLLPDGNSMAVGLDGLFRKAADYIACLEMQVKVMQIMVRVLSVDANE